MPRPGSSGWLVDLFGDMTPTEIYDQFIAMEMSPLLQRRRSVAIAGRVRLLALAFAVLTPLWIPIDLLVFPSPLSYYLVGLRLLAVLSFGMVARFSGPSDGIADAYRDLGLLLAVPVLFFLAAQPILSEYRVSGDVAGVVAASYSYLPCVVVAGLSLFPITLLEGFCFVLPVILAHLVVASLGYEVLSFSSHIGVMWMIVLLGAVGTLAGMIQLRTLDRLIAQASHDGLTRAYTRRVGEELLTILFEQANRYHMPMSVAYLDLDDFRVINERFGHGAGDNVLRHAADELLRMLRRTDILIRWSGEEFLLVMPNTDGFGASIALRRFRAAGLGLRPDGRLLTASIGISERIVDHCQDWADLVSRADQRMYAAKQAGKDRLVLTGDEIVI